MSKLSAVWTLIAALCSTALATSTPFRLPVWLPTRQEVALLTPDGVVLPGGRTVSPAQAGQEHALGPGRWVRVQREEAGQVGEYRVKLQVIDAAGQVTAQREWLARNPYGDWQLLATRRGPCLFWSEIDPGAAHCYREDLQTPWASFPGRPLAVTRDGEWAYSVTAAPSHARPSLDILIDRTRLGTGERVTLKLRFASPGKEAQTLEALEVLGTTAHTRSWQELPGGRFLICLGFGLTNSGCGLTVIDRDARRLYDFGQDFPYVLPLTLNRDASLTAYTGTSLHLWTTATGSYLRVIAARRLSRLLA